MNEILTTYSFLVSVDDQHLTYPMYDSALITINVTDISCELCSDEYICNKGTTISTLKLKQNYF